MTSQRRGQQWRLSLIRLICEYEATYRTDWIPSALELEASSGVSADVLRRTVGGLVDLARATRLTLPPEVTARPWLDIGTEFRAPDIDPTVELEVTAFAVWHCIIELDTAVAGLSDDSPSRIAQAAALAAIRIAADGIIERRPYPVLVDLWDRWLGTWTSLIDARGEGRQRLSKRG